MSRRFVISDPHGHLDDLTRVLRSRDLVDDDGAWAGGTDRLFVLGDFFDRGPDGVGVVDALMRWQREADATGGHVDALIGNHEALALGMYRFGPSAGAADSRRESSFASSWVRNGGQAGDQDRLTDAHVTWLTGLPSILVDDDLLLLHSDTREYLVWGDDVDAINTAVGGALSGRDAEAAWHCWTRLTDRYAFLGSDGLAAARDLLARLGGERIVHGHSIIADLTGGQPVQTAGPWAYADDLVLAIDGGRYAGGPLLLVEL